MTNPDEQHGASDEQAAASTPAAGPERGDSAVPGGVPDDPAPARAGTSSDPAASPHQPPAAPGVYAPGYPFVQGGYPPAPGAYAQGYPPAYPYPGYPYPGYPYSGGDVPDAGTAAAGYPPPPAGGYPPPPGGYPPPYPPYGGPQTAPYPAQPHGQPPYATPGHPGAGHPQPGYPPAGAPYARDAGYGAPGAGPAPAAHVPGRAPGTSARASAFQSVPVRDYVTDAVALVLLLVSLGLGWDFRYAANERVEVVLLTVVSILSLSLFYLARSGALPRGWTNRTVLGVRALANLPYALLVLVYLVLDVSRAFTDGPAQGTVPGGVGPAVAVGLAGAVLAATPRAAELRSPRTAELAAAWTRRALVGLLATAVVLQLVGLVSLIADASIWVRSATAAMGVASVVIAALVAAAVVVGPLLGVVLGSGPWRRVLIATAATATAAFVFYAPLHHEQAESGLHAATSVALWDAAYVVLPAAGVLVLSPIWQRLVRPPVSVVRGWFDAASLAWTSIAVVAGGLVLVHLVVLVTLAGQRDGVDGWRVQLVLLLAACAAAALVARALFDVDNPGTRAGALALTLAVVVLGFVAVILAGQQRPFSWTTVDVPVLLVAFGLPALVGIALLGPTPVRAWFATHSAGPRPAWDDNDPEPAGPPAASASAGADGPATPTPDVTVPASSAAVIPSQPSSPEWHGAAAPEAAAPSQPAAVVHADEGVDETTHPRQAAAQDRASTEQQGRAEDDDEGATWFDEYSSTGSAQVPVEAGQQDVPVEAVPDETIAIAVPEPAQDDAVVVSEASPAPHGGDVAPPPHPFTVEQALDPSTDLEVLAAIAAQAPELRVHLAANPSTYPDLLDWLGRLGDPEIDAALARRRD